MDNLLITLYNSGKITDEEIAEFNNWYKEITRCCVCGVKLMHNDEVYSDSVTGGTLCVSHSIMDVETNLYKGINSVDTYNEILKTRADLNEIKENNFASNDKLIDELCSKVQQLSTYYIKILKIEENGV